MSDRRNWWPGALRALQFRFALFFLLSIGVTPAGADPLDTFRDCDACPEMIELPMGEFVMGAPDSEFRRIVYYRDGGFQIATPEAPYIPENEGPQHRVTVDIRIAMGRNEVTWDEWMACVDDGGCNGYVPDNRIGSSGTDEAIIRSLDPRNFKPLPSHDAMQKAFESGGLLHISGRYPMLYISYDDAQSYVDWLNRKLGTDAYRLPTEAEWEYAARAGTTTRFAQGYEPTPEQANLSGEVTELALMADRPDLRTLPFPVPVDEMDAANPWGLRHMSGNAGEITMSCYTERYQGWATTSEWLEKSGGRNCDHASRGGSFFAPMDGGRAASRMAITQQMTRSQYEGFRVVKEVR